MAALDGRDEVGLAGRDFLRGYLSQAPAALALLRAIECREIAEVEFARPILDVGCGDGLFGQVLFTKCPVNEARLVEKPCPEVGLDHSPRELRSAARRGSYGALVCADVAALPFVDGCFATVLANGVLEHVHGLTNALGEVARVLRPNGQLIFTVPLAQEALQPGGAPSWIRPRWLARLHGRAYNKVFGQVNMYPVGTWSELLRGSGLRLAHYHTYSSRRVFRLHNLLLPSSLPGLLCKRVTGRWILCPALRRATWGALGARLLRRFYLPEDARSGLWLLGVSQRQRAE